VDLNNNVTNQENDIPIVTAETMTGHGGTPGTPAVAQRSVTMQKLVEIVAPTDLPKGYMIEIEVDGHVRSVTVPKNIQANEKFLGKGRKRVTQEDIA
jgi:hypothetical protein